MCKGKVREYRENRRQQREEQRTKIKAKKGDWKETVREDRMRTEGRERV